MQPFSRAEIMDFYKGIEDKVPQSTIDWRIYELNKTGIIHRVGRGMYTISNKEKFTPTVSDELVEIFSKLSTNFPFSKLCVWQSSLINKFTQHLTSTSINYIEVDKESAESVFYFLQSNGAKQVFLEPSRELQERYLTQTTNTFIVKYLISEAPLQFVDKTVTTTIEKLLVDLYCDKTDFYAFQGSELIHIYSNAFNKCIINQSSLLRYASRRGVKEEIKAFINLKIGKIVQ